MRLMIIGSLREQLGTATKIAVSRGAKVVHVENIEQAMAALRAGQGADLLMADVAVDIALLISNLHQEHFHLPVVACGLETDTAAAVKAIQSGAKEYIPLPPDADLIAAVLEAVTEESTNLIFRDPAMAQVVEYAERFAPSEASILIDGESGTGKEVLARYIHSKSKRASQQMVSINCAAIPENLLESELFGHEKGAFTGAVARRVGKFEEANGGTLLLDEISEMDIRLQAKLLRAIQERVIDRVGGTKPIPVDIRVIATTNRNLADEVAKGNFREDLMYRLNVVNLKIPPLRERKLDIDALTDHFVIKYAKINDVPERNLAAATKTLFQGMPWRGNVRELENTIHRAVLLANGAEIEPSDIMMPDGTSPVTTNEQTSPEQVTAGNTGSTGAASDNASDAPSGLIGQTVAEVEQSLIIDTLNHCLGNRTHAANILGISIRTLRNKLKQYGEQGTMVPAAGATQAPLGGHAN